MIDVDATVVDRLTNAGAVLVAELATGELALGDVWFGGQTRNPWNPSEGSGGSSAGPASAVSAGLVGFAIGTETRGSILGPSIRCGVTGFKPDRPTRDYAAERIYRSRQANELRARRTRVRGSRSAGGCENVPGGNALALETSSVGVA